MGFRIYFLLALLPSFCFSQKNSYVYNRNNSALEFKYPDYYKVKEADGGIQIIDTIAKGKRTPKWTIWPMDPVNGVSIDETIEMAKGEAGGCEETRDTTRVGGLPAVRVILTNTKTKATCAYLLFFEKNQDVYEVEALKPNMAEVEEFVNSLSFQ